MHGVGGGESHTGGNVNQPYVTDLTKLIVPLHSWPGLPICDGQRVHYPLMPLFAGGFSRVMLLLLGSCV
jgi:hypothetical protein